MNENIKKFEQIDEEERITAIIYSDPELRELYSTNKDEAITQARIKMFENAETDSVPLTTKKMMKKDIFQKCKEKEYERKN